MCSLKEIRKCNMKKVLMILVFILFLSGCDIDYQLNYKSSDKILEKLEVSVENEVINLYSENSDVYFKDVFNSYKTAYDLRNYKYKIFELGSYSKISVSKIHHSAESVIDNSLFDSYFANKSITENDGEITFHLSDYLFLQDEDWDIPAVPITIVIKSNYIVESNAQDVNNFLGIYKWTFNSEDSGQFLNITFTNRLNVTAWLFNLNVMVYIIVLVFVISIILLILIKLYKNKIKNVNKI